MEDAASKLRSKRVEGDERKKEKAVKYTDRLPPPKRVKTGSSCMSPIIPETWLHVSHT